MPWPWTSRFRRRAASDLESGKLRVLLASDASPASAAAEQATVWIRRALGAEVSAIVVGSQAADPKDQENEVMFKHAVPDPAAAAAAIQDRLNAAGVAATVTAVRGPVAPTIVAAARHVDVLVMGNSQTGHLEFRGSGTIVDQVKNYVPCSILVARHGRPRAVAAAIDGSQPSIIAGRMAAHWATALDVPLRLLLADGVSKIPGLSSSDRETVAGDAARALVDWSRRHPDHLLVLGSRGQSNATLLHLGSVSDRVYLGATCSVLVVRPRRPGFNPHPAP